MYGGARENNLRNVSLDLPPRDSLIVFTGLSGSGKSSLAFDTIFAEGQRRYVESLSSYARQFLDQADKPDVDFIEGLSPAVSIDQKSTSRNPRSTVGTITEVHDYLRLLYARAGRPHCPVCGGEPIARQTPQQIVDRLMALPEGTRFQVLAPVVRGRKGEHLEVFSQLAGDGFARVRVDGTVHQLTHPPTLNKQQKHQIDAVVDRIAIKPTAKQRLTDSVETALRLANGGVVGVEFVDRPADDPERERRYSEKMACPPTSTTSRSRNSNRVSSPSTRLGGPAPECTGLGTKMEVDPDLVIPDRSKSLAEGAVAPWAGAHVADYFGKLLTAMGQARDFSMDTPLGGIAGHHPGPHPERGGGGTAGRALPQPVRPGTLLLRQLRGCDPFRAPAPQRGRQRRGPGTVRRLHARGSVFGLPRGPAQADLPGGHRRRSQHRRAQ